MLHLVRSKYHAVILGQLRTQHVGKRVVLPFDLDDGSIGDFSVGDDFDPAVSTWLPSMSASVTYFSTPSGKMKSSNLSGAFIVVRRRVGGVKFHHFGASVTWVRGCTGAGRAWLVGTAPADGFGRRARCTGAVLGLLGVRVARRLGASLCGHERVKISLLGLAASRKLSGSDGRAREPQAPFGTARSLSVCSPPKHAPVPPHGVMQERSFLHASPLALFFYLTISSFLTEKPFFGPSCPTKRTAGPTRACP